MMMRTWGGLGDVTMSLMVPLQCRHEPSLASCRECCFYNYVLFELLWQNKISSSSSSSSTLKTLYSVSLYIFYVVNILFLVLLFLHLPLFMCSAV